jgi:organic radical activating enzyme
LHAGLFARKIKPGAPTNEEIETFIDRVLNIHLMDRFLNMTLSGGEPTLHPMFKTIVERMGPRGSIEVVTNGSRSVEWWQDMKVLPNKVTISLHPEFSNLDKINDLGLFLKDNGVDLAFNLMCDPKNWDWVINVKQLLNERLHGHINAKILTDHSGTFKDGTPYEYYEQQLDFIKKQQSTVATNTDPRKHTFAIYSDGTQTGLDAFKLVTNKQHSFKGWACSAGHAGLKIGFDGQVTAGICEITKLGRLDTFELGPKEITCIRQWCKTAGDLNLNKRLLVPKISDAKLA